MAKTLSWVPIRPSLRVKPPVDYGLVQVQTVLEGFTLFLKVQGDAPDDSDAHTAELGPTLADRPTLNITCMSFTL